MFWRRAEITTPDLMLLRRRLVQLEASRALSAAAADDIKAGRGEGTSLYQIEANARAVLGSEGVKTPKRYLNYTRFYRWRRRRGLITTAEGGEMKFLWSGGGAVSTEFAGVLTTPAHRQIPVSIAAGGAKWAADNQVFTKRFDAFAYFEWLNGRMLPYRENCLFVAVPDFVGDAHKTEEMFDYWYRHFSGWPLAFVAPDGQENLPLPPSEMWQCLFVGGSTAWKESYAAIEVIKLAQSLGKHIHIGRVNWKRRGIPNYYPNQWIGRVDL